MDLRVLCAERKARQCCFRREMPVGCKATWGRERKHEGVGQLVVGEMRVGWNIMVHRYCFIELAMAPVCELVCVCVTHRAIALAAATAHLAAYHNKGAQLIRPQSEGNREKKERRKKWEDVKGDLKYAA